MLGLRGVLGVLVGVEVLEALGLEGEAFGEGLEAFLGEVFGVTGLRLLDGVAVWGVGGAFAALGDVAVFGAGDCAFFPFAGAAFRVGDLSRAVGENEATFLQVS